MNDDIRELLATVLAHPDDDASRRVYGDALIAAGDPRGELIHVQCELEQRTPGEPQWTELLRRERELLGKHEKSWAAPYKAFLFRPAFRRGMIEDAWVGAKKFIANPGALLEHEPVMSLGTRELTQAGAALLGARPELARLRAFRVSEAKLGARAIEALFAQPLPELRKLNLYQAGLDDDGLAHLGKTVLPKLERLNISGTRVTYNGLEKLLGDRSLEHLHYLNLMWLAPGTDGADFLAEHLALPALTHVDLGSSHYNNGDLAQLAGNRSFQQLRGLRLEHNNLSGPGAIEALAPLTQLEVLDISTNEIDTAAIEVLAKTRQPLRVLRLYQCGIGDDELEILANNDTLPLRRLDLGYGGAGARGLAAIGRTSWPLEKLELWANKIGDAGAAALAKASFTRTLRELVVGYNAIGDAGATALAAGDWPRLERLVFRGDPIGEAGAHALAASTTMPALRYLKLEGMSTPKRALAPLRKRGVEIEM